MAERKHVFVLAVDGGEVGHGCILLAPSDIVMLDINLACDCHAI